ncbi:MAG: GNAT family N-acetyltransferase [Bacteroidetes bacterium]|nr:MAG: GNAT family N-acetyltransferase [Bacteroidota bacterium]
MDQYLFRPINEDRLPDINRLVQQVMGKRLGVPYYLEKYNTPRKAENVAVGWLAYEKESERLVAMATGLPFWGVLPDGNRIPITQIEGIFTLPDHQRRGLMSRLVQHIVEDHRHSGTRLFFIMLIEGHLNSFLRLGFTHTQTLNRFELHVSTIPVEAICRKLNLRKLYRWWARKAITPCLAPVDQVLPNAVLAEGFGGVLHDRAFYKYKTLSFNRVCRVAGIDSWLRFENGLWVGDVVLPENCPEEQLEDWLRQLRKLARRLGLRRILFQLAADSQLAVRLAARYPASPSWSVASLAGDAEMEPYIRQMRYGFGDYDTF